MNFPVSRPEPSIEEKILSRIPREILILSLLISLLSLFLLDPLSSLLIFAGGALSALSFIWLKQSLSRFLVPDKKKAMRSAIGFYSLRLLLIIVLFSIIIFLFSKKIIAFVAGFSTIILVMAVESIAALSRIKKWNN